MLHVVRHVETARLLKNTDKSSGRAREFKGCVCVVSRAFVRLRSACAAGAGLPRCLRKQHRRLAVGYGRSMLCEGAGRATDENTSIPGGYGQRKPGSL